MPVRRKKNAASAEEQARQMRAQRLKLLIQQYETEAQRRVAEVKGRLEDLLAGVDRVFEVELMKIPQAIQKSCILDHVGEREAATDEKVESMGSQKLRRTRTKGRPTATPRPSIKKTSVARGGRKVLTSSVSSGDIGRQKMGNCDHVQGKPKLRSTVSTGDLHCTAEGSMAHISFTTALGQTVCISEETKDDIDVDLLDAVAIVQIQSLAMLIGNLKAKAERSSFNL